MTQVQDFLIISARETFFADMVIDVPAEQEFLFALPDDIAIDQHAILQCDVHLVTQTGKAPAIVLNGVQVGQIDSYDRSVCAQGDPCCWMQDTLIIPSHTLRAGENRLEVKTPRGLFARSTMRPRGVGLRNIGLFYRTSASARTISVA